jgi:chemotaxis family two-component system response regulator Rcp1
MVSLTKKIFRSINVLLVEDNLGDVTLIKEAFKASKRPIQISRVKDGLEAMDFLRGHGRFKNHNKPDLILLDLNMPKKSGLEVLDEIKSDPRLREIPVVVLTNSAANEDFHKAYAARANFYMVKPTDLDQLFVAMRYVENIWLRSIRMEAD